MADELLTIGQVADRTGVATSALRFYESRGLITSDRTTGNQRRYHRSVIRVISVIRAAQSVGLSLEEIGDALAGMPGGRVPTKADWTKLSKGWRSRLDEQIRQLEALRAELSDCIGCGCLSLKGCALYNPSDAAATGGTGPRYLLGDDRPR